MPRRKGVALNTAQNRVRATEQLRRVVECLPLDTFHQHNWETLLDIVVVALRHSLHIKSKSDSGIVRHVRELRVGSRLVRRGLVLGQIVCEVDSYRDAYSAGGAYHLGPKANCCYILHNAGEDFFFIARETPRLPSRWKQPGGVRSDELANEWAEIWPRVLDQFDGESFSQAEVEARIGRERAMVRKSLLTCKAVEFYGYSAQMSINTRNLIKNGTLGVGSDVILRLSFNIHPRKQQVPASSHGTKHAIETDGFEAPVDFAVIGDDEEEGKEEDLDVEPPAVTSRGQSSNYQPPRRQSRRYELAETSKTTSLAPQFPTAAASAINEAFTAGLREAIKPFQQQLEDQQRQLDESRGVEAQLDEMRGLVQGLRQEMAKMQKKLDQCAHKQMRASQRLDAEESRASHLQQVLDRQEDTLQMIGRDAEVEQVQRILDLRPRLDASLPEEIAALRDKADKIASDAGICLGGREASMSPMGDSYEEVSPTDVALQVIRRDVLELQQHGAL